MDLDQFIEHLRKTIEDREPIRPVALEELAPCVLNLRDAVLISLFLEVGLRVSEIASLNRDTIVIHEEQDYRGRKQTVGRGKLALKGSNCKQFYLGEQLLHTYLKYLASRTDRNSALFVGATSHRMSVVVIEQTIIYCWVQLNSAANLISRELAFVVWPAMEARNNGARVLGEMGLAAAAATSNMHNTSGIRVRLLLGSDKDLI